VVFEQQKIIIHLVRQKAKNRILRPRHDNESQIFDSSEPKSLSYELLNDVMGKGLVQEMRRRLNRHREEQQIRNLMGNLFDGVISERPEKRCGVMTVSLSH
jgi:hypothetical protein